MPLTLEQFQKARAGGFTTEQIAGFEKKRTAEQQVSEPNPDTNHFGLFGSVPEKQYQQGERNWAGNVFERPAAAIRSVIQGKGYAAGAINPTNVPTFQDLAIKSAQQSTNPLVNAAIGMPASALGLAADIVTNPADVLSTIIPMTKPAQMAGKAIASTKAGQAIGKAVNAPIRLTKPDSQKIAEAIDTGIRKGIRPSSTGERTRNVAAAKRFDQQATSAVTDIVENKAKLSFEDANGNITTGKLPETLKETASAMDQRMKSLVDEWQQLAASTGSKGGIVETSSMRKELKTLLDDNVFLTEHPSDYAKVKSIYDGLEMRGNLSPVDALEKVQEWNADLKGNYKTGFSYGSTKAPNVVKNMTEQLRSKLSDVIENTTGQEFQSLRSKWGSYKSLIKDVQHRANIAGRANPQGIWSFLDAAGNAELAAGAGMTVTGNPAIGLPLMIKGGALKVGKTLIKRANDPNRIVSKMFKTVDKLYKAPVKATIIPKQKPMLALPSPQTVGKTTPIPSYIKQRQSADIPSLGVKRQPGLNRTPIPEKRIILRGTENIKEKSLSNVPLDINDRLTMAAEEKSLGNLDVLKQQEDTLNLQFRADSAKKELDTISSAKRWLNKSINPDELKTGEFQDLRSKVGWVKAPEGKGSTLDNVATEFFDRYPELKPKEYDNIYPSDALRGVIKDLSLDKGKMYEGELKGIIKSGRVIPKSKGMLGNNKGMANLKDGREVKIGDTVRFQEPGVGGKTYEGEVKRINGNELGIFNRNLNRNYKINSSLSELVKAVKETGGSTLGLTIAGAGLTASALGAKNADAKTNIDIKKINKIESSGNEKAIGDNGEAFGINQIHKGTLSDYNKANKTKYTTKDLMDKKINNKVADWYYNVEAPRLLKSLKMPDTVNNRIRIYNQGYGNMKKGRPIPKTTKDYIKKYEEAK